VINQMNAGDMVPKGPEAEAGWVKGSELKGGAGRKAKGKEQKAAGAQLGGAREGA